MCEYSKFLEEFLKKNTGEISDRIHGTISEIILAESSEENLRKISKRLHEILRKGILEEVLEGICDKIAEDEFLMQGGIL